MTEVLRANIGSKSAISLQPGPVDEGGVASHQSFFFQKTRLNVLSYGIKNLDRFFFRLIARQTDGRSDRIRIARPRLHSATR